MSQRAQYQTPGTGSPKWNAVVFNVINHTSAFLATTCQNVSCEKKKKKKKGPQWDQTTTQAFN